MTTDKRTCTVTSKLIRLVELDNGMREGCILSRLKPASRKRLMTKFETGVGAMIAAGCRFTTKEVELMAMGEQGEAEDHFEKYDGYKKANEALNDLFDPSRRMVLASVVAEWSA